MSHNTDFYVGYQDDSPPNVASFIKRIILLMIILVPILGFVASKFQSNYSNGKFELGKLSEISGVIYAEPVPLIKYLDGFDVDGNQIYKNIPIVSYGKFGADGVLENLNEKVKAQTGNSLEDMYSTIKGTLAYYDGKSVFELTKKERSLINFSHLDSLSNDPVSKPILSELGNTNLKGEIIDPKCYFGAMNPGRGKSHRSCAIMCIRGGIPPILAVESESGQNAYYFLLDENGNRINNDVLDFVGEPVQITGDAFAFDDWYILKIDPASAISRLN